MEQHQLENGQVISSHDRTRCRGHWCPVHRPMPGPWFWWPRRWNDRVGIMERICPCGAAHPVAEMYEQAVVMNHRSLLHHKCCGIHPCTPFDGGYE